jgi:glycosyltransferase involved in cell wall biosynthesis
MDRLVILSDFSFPKGGATSLAVASALVARNANIAVTYFTSEGQTDPALMKAGVDVKKIAGAPVSAVHKLAGAFEGLYRVAAFDAVRKWISENDTPGTIYHLHNWSHFLSPSVFYALRAVSSRLIMTLHDFFLSCPNGAQYSYTENKTCKRPALSISCLTHNCDRRSYADKLWRSARHMTRRSLFNLEREKPHIIAIHEGMIPALLIGGVPETSIEVIRNPIRPFTSTQIDVSPNKEVVFIGRLTYEKGPDLAIRAAKIAGAPIRIIGEGPMKADLIKEASPSQFEGWCDRAKIGHLCEKARMLIMPSRWAEPYGLVAVEALWSGLPIVLSDKAFIASEIAKAGAGISCNADNLDDLSRAISTIANNDSVASRMSNNAYNDTKSIGNTMEAWGDRHLRLYTSRLAQATLA